MREGDLNERERVLGELDRSGVSVAEFCRRRGLAYSTVMAWRRRRRQAVRFVEIVPEVAREGVPVEEVEAVAPVSDGRGSAGRPRDGSRAGSAQAALCVEVCLPGGVSLRVFGTPQGATGRQARRGAEGGVA